MARFTLAGYPGLADFLAREPAATIAVPVDAAGTIHAASLLYWNSTQPLAFYFVTNRKSQKCRLLQSHPKIPCAVVVGTEKGTSHTLQMRGTLSELPGANLDEYYKKRGNRWDDIADEKNMCIAFHPIWARFTDYNKGYERHFLHLGSE